VMNGGRIEQAGSATDLYERPRTAFVANFLGISNLIEAKVTGDERIETHDGATLHAPECGGLTGAVRVGVRPEKITLIPAGEPVPDGSNVLRGTIVVAAFLGVSIQYVIKTAGGEELNVFAQNTDGSEPEALAVGREVQLTWRPEHTFVVEHA
jgi:spermidine/putrescine transport system ATP-binding protein